MNEGVGRAEECFTRSGTGHERREVVLEVGYNFVHEFLRELLPFG